MDINWNKNFELLVEFKRQNGHTNVPHATGKLGIWVDSQRSQYKEYLHRAQGGERTQFATRSNGKPIYRTALSRDRIDKLNSIGFQWQVRACQKPWAVRYKELQQYHAEHGHVNPPVSYNGGDGSCEGLGRWCQYQRGHYQQLKEGKPTRMTQERVEQLDALGFDWKISAQRNDGNEDVDSS